MTAMQTMSVRIPTEDLEWLALFDVPGATTLSDKLRAFVVQMRRQQEGTLDHSASLLWMRELVAPFVASKDSFEHKANKHSDLLRLLCDWLPQAMAVLVAEGHLSRESPRKASEVEEKLAARVFQLITSILRMGVTQTADCYDPRVLEKHLPQVIELAGVIAANRNKPSSKE
jgi:hypothetical protein